MRGDHIPKQAMLYVAAGLLEAIAALIARGQRHEGISGGARMELADAGRHIGRARKLVGDEIGLRRNGEQT